MLTHVLMPSTTIISLSLVPLLQNIRSLDHAYLNRIIIFSYNNKNPIIWNSLFRPK